MNDALPDRSTFARLLAEAGPRPVVPVYRQLLSDALTPVVAYRRLVGEDRRLGPSFLFESVIGGQRIGRYSFLGCRPAAEVIAYQHHVQFIDHHDPSQSHEYESPDPLAEMGRLSQGMSFAAPPGLPDFTGGWVGFAGFDTVRYFEPEKIPFSSAPPDDRGMADLHFQLYHELVVFDHVRKTVLAICNVHADQHASVDAAYQAARGTLDQISEKLSTPNDRLERDRRELAGHHVDLAGPPPHLPVSSLGEGGYQAAVKQALKYVASGDVFQVVPSQRFDIETTADPFDLYRMLRVVNPSPYMFYLQLESGGQATRGADSPRPWPNRPPGAVLVGSSPEILCRVDGRQITSRPLAGTRARGQTEAEDAQLERELLADTKDRAEHVMLVDLHRNDVGRVAKLGTIRLPELLTVERYSHVMHLSSEVQGLLRDGLDAWDVLRVCLPVGTLSGAPKVRAIQVIDELERTRRGPYGGAVGYADYAGNMDMAIALRTMVVLPRSGEGSSETEAADRWSVHLQAGGGIVAESEPEAEHRETMDKAAALAKAVQLAETAFADP